MQAHSVVVITSFSFSIGNLSWLPMTFILEVLVKNTTTLYAKRPLRLDPVLKGLDWTRSTAFAHDVIKSLAAPPIHRTLPLLRLLLVDNLL